MHALVDQIGDAFVGESVETGRAKLLLVHVIDEADDCEFDECITKTPQDLPHMGKIYCEPAVPLFRESNFRSVSLALAAEALGPLRRVRGRCGSGVSQGLSRMISRSAAAVAAEEASADDEVESIGRDSQGTTKQGSASCVTRADEAAPAAAPNLVGGSALVATPCCDRVVPMVPDGRTEPQAEVRSVTPA